MGKSISIDNEIRIRNVKKVWEKVKALKTPVTIDLKEVVNVDGAGLQLIIFLLTQSDKYPKKYMIDGISEKLKIQLITNGYVIEKGEEI